MPLNGRRQGTRALKAMGVSRGWLQWMQWRWQGRSVGGGRARVCAVHAEQGLHLVRASAEVYCCGGVGGPLLRMVSGGKSSIFWGGVGLMTRAAPLALGPAAAENFCFSSGLRAW